jgi:hypothetical protein
LGLLFWFVEKQQLQPELKALFSKKKEILVTVMLSDDQRAGHTIHVAVRRRQGGSH